MATIPLQDRVAYLSTIGRGRCSVFGPITQKHTRQQQTYLCELCPAIYNTSLRGFYVGIVPKKMNTKRCSFLFRPFDAQKFIDQETSTDCQSIQTSNHGQTWRQIIKPGVLAIGGRAYFCYRTTRSSFSMTYKILRMNTIMNTIWSWTQDRRERMNNANEIICVLCTRRTADFLSQ